ncbi:MAG: GNAT family N-acetyltransferase [Pseudomonadota bacterium]
MSYSAAPILETERLVLRPYCEADFERFASYFASPRSIHTDGPVSRTTAWDLFTAGSGRWMIVGYGAWTVAHKSDAEAIGIVSLNTAIDLPHHELGWILWEEFEGHGFAYEAAMRARDFAFTDLGWKTLISGIHKDNNRSIMLAERLGASLDTSLKLASEPETVFYRHKPR